jgi:hypothetical protein
VKSKIRGTKMTRNTTNLSILTLNLNGLNTPIKRHKIENYFKNKAQSFVVSKKQLTGKNKHWIRIKGWKKIFPNKWTSKTSRII